MHLICRVCQTRFLDDLGLAHAVHTSSICGESCPVSEVELYHHASFSWLGHTFCGACYEAFLLLPGRDRRGCPVCCTFNPITNAIGANTPHHAALNGRPFGREEVVRLYVTFEDPENVEIRHAETVKRCVYMNLTRYLC